MEIRQATLNEQLIGWLDGQLAIHDELAQESIVGGFHLQEVGATPMSLGIYNTDAWRALAQAVGAKVRVIRNSDKHILTHTLTFKYKGIDINAYEDEKYLTDAEKAAEEAER